MGDRLTTNEPHVAVLGAGIAGLTLSAALDRLGVRHEVYEQAAELSEVGAGIQLAPNAVRVLDRLGLAGHLRSTAVRIDAIEMRRWDDGTTISRLSLGAECERVFGAAYYTIHRADLVAGLAAVAPTVHRLGRRCELVESDVDGARLVFDHGAVHADVVAGADGIHSVVRERITPDRPRFSGQTIYRGLVPADPRAGHARVELFLGPGQHAVVYPVAGGTLLSFAATTPTRGWTDESWSAPGSVPELLAAYRGWHPDLRAVLASAGSVRRWAVHDRDVIPRWCHGRLTLLGDAAHPMLPFFAQGANQAIEDAAVLARCLSTADTPEGVAGALRTYEAERGPRTERVHRTSRENSRLLHLPDGPEQRDRDRRLAGGARLAARAWLYGYDADRAPAMTGGGR